MTDFGQPVVVDEIDSTVNGNTPGGHKPAPQGWAAQMWNVGFSQMWNMGRGTFTIIFGITVALWWTNYLVVRWLSELVK